MNAPTHPPAGGPSSPEAASGEMTLRHPVPVVVVDSVYHVGTLNPELRSTNGGSLEFNNLSVSVCPAAWTEIARLGGMPTWQLSRTGGTFLDVLELRRRPTLFTEAMDWARAHGLYEVRNGYRVYHWDDEEGDWRFMLLPTQEAAEEEAADAVAARGCSLQDGGPDGGPAVRPVPIRDGTPALAAMLGLGPEWSMEDCDDLCLIAWVNAVHPAMDGVWWREELAPGSLSAPRGCIFPQTFARWATTELAKGQAAEDEQLLQTCSCGDLRCSERASAFVEASIREDGP